MKKTMHPAMIKQQQIMKLAAKYMKSDPMMSRKQAWKKAKHNIELSIQEMHQGTSSDYYAKQNPLISPRAHLSTKECLNPKTTAELEEMYKNARKYGYTSAGMVKPEYGGGWFFANKEKEIYEHWTFNKKYNLWHCSPEKPKKKNPLGVITCPIADCGSSNIVVTGTGGSNIQYKECKNCGYQWKEKDGEFIEGYGYAGEENPGRTNPAHKEEIKHAAKLVKEGVEYQRIVDEIIKKFRLGATMAAYIVKSAARQLENPSSAYHETQRRLAEKQIPQTKRKEYWRGRHDSEMLSVLKSNPKKGQSRYLGILEYHGSHALYTYAYSPVQARRFLIKQFAEKLGVNEIEIRKAAGKGDLTIHLDNPGTSAARASYYLGISKDMPSIGMIVTDHVRPSRSRYPEFTQMVGPFANLRDLARSAMDLGIKISNPGAAWHKAELKEVKKDRKKFYGLKKYSSEDYDVGRYDGYIRAEEDALDESERLKINTPRGAVEIYDKIEAIEAVKGDGSLWPKTPFRHDFKGKTAAKIYGMPDGSLTIKGKKPLWKQFNYPEKTRRSNPAKQIVQLDNLYFDQITLHNGIYTARQSYFYTHGKSERNMIDRILSIYPEAQILDSGSIYKSFKGSAPLEKQSHWWVKFKLPKYNPLHKTVPIGEAEVGDLVDFGVYGKLYVVKFLGEKLWVTDLHPNEWFEYGKNIPGWYISKYDANHPVLSLAKTAGKWALGKVIKKNPGHPPKSGHTKEKRFRIKSRSISELEEDLKFEEARGNYHEAYNIRQKLMKMYKKNAAPASSGRRSKATIRSSKIKNKRGPNLAMIAGAIRSPKTPQRLKEGLIRKYKSQLMAAGVI